MSEGAAASPQIRTPGPGCFPYGFKKEAVAMFHLAWPLSLSILFHYLIQPISLAFCGHLGRKQLASVAMSISVIYVTTVSCGRGLAFGGDTFFSQSYGSANKKIMGLYLQKGIIFGLFTAMPIWAILLNTRSILLLIGQDPDIADLAQEYVLYFTPGVLAYIWLFMLMRYLLCQNRVLPNFFICVVSCGVCALLHYGLLFQAGMDIRGSAIALASTYYLVLFLFVAYIWGSGVYHETWPGWSFECLEDWGPFARTAMASIAMTFIFWLCTEIGTFLAGMLREVDISAFQIMFQVEGFAWMIPLGLGGACAARVGQYLGANEPMGAITAVRVALIITIFISIFLAGITYALKAQIPALFTGDRGVIQYTAALMPICAMFLLFEGFGGVGVGIIRGAGRQTLGTVIIFISYYLVALPIGIPLMFATNLELAGLWWGFVIGLALQDVMLLLFVAKVNWYDEAHKAQVRAGVVFKETSVNPTETANADPEANERTRLLGSRGTTESADRLAGGSRSYESLPSPIPNRTALVLKRLATFLFFCAILAAGILIRIFVHVPAHKKWTQLCLPLPNSTETPPTWEGVTPVYDNTTLAYCNMTSPVSYTNNLFIGVGRWP